MELSLLIQKFWKNINFQSKDGCWNWIASKNRAGYGRIWLQGVRILAHRFSWELTFGKISKGFRIFHHCNNPSCVNPKHLFLGTPFERFWDKVDKRDDEKCWNWIGGKNLDGYGHIVIKQKEMQAHRVIWELTYGKIPKGLCCLHKCDNSSCVNPNHLFLGTHKDNMKDMAIKGRARISIGDKNPSAKLKEYQIYDILRSKKSVVVLADQYKVHHSTIHRIKNGKTWKHIKSA